MQTPQALLDNVSAFISKKGSGSCSERRRSEADVNIQRSEKQWHGDPDYAIERIARCLLPMIQGVL